MGRETSRIVTIALLLVALALSAYGVYTGEQELVERKADMVCTQCIGLG